MASATYKQEDSIQLVVVVNQAKDFSGRVAQSQRSVAQPIVIGTKKVRSYEREAPRVALRLQLSQKCPKNQRDTNQLSPLLRTRRRDVEGQLVHSDPIGDG